MPKRPLTPCLLLALMLFCAPYQACASSSSQAQQLAEQHLRLQFQEQGEQVSIQVSPPDLSRLPECQLMEAFSPPGAAGMNKTTVGIRCLQPAKWSILLPAQIAITGNFVVTARPVAAGQAISAEDIRLRSGNLAALPPGTIATPDEAIGKSLRNSMGSGLPIRKDQLMTPLLVRQGQNIRVSSRGNGFSIQSEGRALNNASAGQQVQVRMPSGQTISGTVLADGSVDISF